MKIVQLFATIKTNSSPRNALWNVCGAMTRESEVGAVKLHIWRVGAKIRLALGEMREIIHTNPGRCGVGRWAGFCPLICLT